MRPNSASLGWDKPIENALVGICPVTKMELLFGARSKDDREYVKQRLALTYAWVLMPDRVFQRATEVQEMLTEKGQHRSAGPVDLLVAATAELTGRTLLHYDHDFETIAQTTGQQTRWLATPGAIA